MLGNDLVLALLDGVPVELGGAEVLDAEIGELEVAEGAEAVVCGDDDDGPGGGQLVVR